MPVGWIVEKPTSLDWPEAAVFQLPASRRQAVEPLDSTAAHRSCTARGVMGGWIATALAHAGTRVVATAGQRRSRLAAAGVAEVVDRRD